MSAPDPRLSEPAIQTAARLLAEGRPGEAATRLAVLVGEAPTYAAAHVLLATALEAAGHIDEALVAWGRAAALVPRSPLVHRERERLLAIHVASGSPVDLPPPLPAAPVEGEGEAGPAPDPPSGEPPSAPELADAPAAAEAAPAVDERTVEDLAAQAMPDTPLLDHEDDVHDLAPEAEEDADEPLLDFGAPAPEAHPLVGATTPQPFDASDLVFADLPMTPEPAAEAPAAEEPVADETSAEADAAPPGPDLPGTPPDAVPPLSPLSPIAADWGADETGLAAVVPPEGDLPPFAAVPEPTPASDAGWDVVSESTIPTPPPGAYAEPDIVAPEAREEAPFADDPFADVDAMVDEFDAPPPADAPPPDDAPPADRTVADELDALIAQLEDAPRIRPDPEYHGPEVSLDAGDVDDMVSETLAKIYAAQHQYVEAALVYEKLAARQPEDADALLERAAELRRRGG